MYKFIGRYMKGTYIWVGCAGVAIELRMNVGQSEEVNV